MATTQSHSSNHQLSTPANSGKIPDTHSQLEDLLGAVWSAEANWRLDDRLDLALKAVSLKRRPGQRSQ